MERKIAPSSIKENEQSANFGTERERQRRKLITEGLFAAPEKEGVSASDSKKIHLFLDESALLIGLCDLDNGTRCLLLLF